MIKNDSDDEFAAIAEGKEVPKSSVEQATKTTKEMQDKLQNKFNKYANPNFASLNKKPKIRSGGGAGLFQNRLGQKAAKLKSIVENEKESITSKITEIKEDTEEVEQKAKTS